MWSSKWNENWQGRPKYSEKKLPQCHLSTTNSTCNGLDSKPGSSGGKPAMNHLSYSTAYFTVYQGRYFISTCSRYKIFHCCREIMSPVSAYFNTCINNYLLRSMHKRELFQLLKLLLLLTENDIIVGC
jgi:hypothetical protein